MQRLAVPDRPDSIMNQQLGYPEGVEGRVKSAGRVEGLSSKTDPVDDLCLSEVRV